MKKKLIWILSVVLDAVMLIVCLLGAVFLYSLDTALLEIHAAFGGFLVWGLAVFYVFLVRYALVRFMPSKVMKKYYV